MRNIKQQLTLSILLSFLLPLCGFSQGTSTNELRFEVNSVFHYHSIAQKNLHKTTTLVDINHFYKPAWVRTYHSVEFSALSNGKTIKAFGKSDTLNQSQIDLIKNADAGTDIYVKINYTPENNLKQNDPKVFDFKFAIDPEREASYPGGQESLKNYLKEKAIAKIAKASFKADKLSAVKFIINEKGEIVNPHIFESNPNNPNSEETDQILVEAIRNMPCWSPAEYADGTKTKQEFVLTVGNMESCVINMLDIKRDK